jgi:TolB protein
MTRNSQAFFPELNPEVAKKTTGLTGKFLPAATRILLVVLLFGFSLETGAAEHEILVTGEAFQKTRVAVPGFTRSGAPDTSAVTQTLTETLRFDLDHSGFFTVVPDSRNAEVLVKANYVVSGNDITTDCYVHEAAGNKALFGRRLTGKADQARRVVHRMADVIVKEMTRVDGIASTRIAFVADSGGRNKNICLIDYDGKNLVELTHDKTLSLAPDWSPNGKTLYYTSYLYGYPRVCAIELATGRRWLISSYPGLNALPAISPRGDEMALTLSKDGCVEIYSASLDGSNPHRLTRSQGGLASSPCWSPNGAQIAFVSNRSGGAQIYAMNTDGSNVRRLLSGFSYVTSVDWSPRENKIAFSSRYQGTLQIFVFDLDRRVVRQVTFDSASHENPSFAPNGIHIVYVATSGYESDLYIADTRDLESKPFRLTSLTGDETYPAWSPVGY